MEDDKNVKACKEVLLWESGVGKAFIIDKFINDNFEDSQKTTGISTFIAKTMTFEKYESKSIKFKIWDTTRKEKYLFLNRIFYKDSRVTILVYDITNKESFEEIQKYWYNQLKEFASKDICKTLYIFKYFFFSHWNSRK